MREVNLAGLDLNLLPALEALLRRRNVTHAAAEVGRPVVFNVASTDVLHSFTLPNFRNKVDAVPGYTTYTWFKAKGPALYHGNCAQLCGRQHAFMTALVDVVSPAAYQVWLQRQSKLISTANSQVTQLRSYLMRTGNL